MYVTLMESDTLQGFGRTEVGTSPGGGCVRNPRTNPVYYSEINRELSRRLIINDIHWVPRVTGPPKDGDEVTTV